MVNNMNKTKKKSDVQVILDLIPEMKKHKIIAFSYKDFECQFHPSAFQDFTFAASIDPEIAKKQLEQEAEDILFHSA